MTDRELLELAAKAAGLSITGWNKRNSQHVAVLSDGSYWQPLLENTITDTDGDALRLAVKLSLTVYQWSGSECCVCTEDGVINESVPYGENMFAGTRRAIVLAAAEIGRKM